MPSYDGIMEKSLYRGTSEIINLVTEIGKLLGIIDATYLRVPSASLRKINRIKTIQSSLWIEGNTLSEEQVSDIINQKRVYGPEKDILEVKNAISVYANLAKYNFKSIDSYLRAHQDLLVGLIESAGKFRVKGVGIFKGEKVAHVAPPAWNVKNLMEELFDYVRKSKDNLIIKSCVFHYEMEFIHPFMDGNGRIGRLWQTLILMQENPVFEFLPIENQIKSQQQAYYYALALSDKQGDCTVFLEYMLCLIRDSLTELVNQQRTSYSDIERIRYFKENFKRVEFVRKDYLNMFKDISTATATRDLLKGVEQQLWTKIGDNRNTKYFFT